MMVQAACAKCSIFLPEVDVAFASATAVDDPPKLLASALALAVAVEGVGPTAH